MTRTREELERIIAASTGRGSGYTRRIEEARRQLEQLNKEAGNGQ